MEIALKQGAIEPREVTTMEHTRAKVIITVLALLLLAAAIFVIANKQGSSTGESFPAPGMEACELG